MQIHRVLVPTDFSETARAGIDDAMALCRRFEAELHLLHIYAPPLQYPDMAGMQMPIIDDFSEEFRRTAEIRMEKLVDELDTTLPLHRHLHESLENTAEAIVRFAEELPADLIVIGRHGHGMLERLLIGSTAERVVRHARQAVWVASPKRE